MLTFGLICPFTGISIARFGPRIHIIVGNLLVALGLAGIFFVHEIWQVYLLYSIMGIGGGIAHFPTAAAVVNNWFINKRTLAQGICVSSLGLGGVIIPPLTTNLISSFGWQISCLILAGIIFLGAGVIGGIILVRDKPEDLGQYPDGIDPESTVKTETTDRSLEAGPARWTIGQALHHPTTWLIIVFYSANVFGLGMLTAHQVAYIQDLGFSAMAGATTVSVNSITNLCGTLIFGTLALKYNLRYLTCACLALMAVAMVILLTSKNLGQIYLFAALYGLGSGAFLTAETSIIGAYYGRNSFSRILGVVLPFVMVSQAVGPFVAGAIYDFTAGYTISFIIIVATLVVGIILCFLARPPKLPISQVSAASPERSG
jgi:MFS family permease